MSKQGPEASVGWPLWAKIVASLAIVWHFFAISLAVTSEEGPGGAPQLARDIYFGNREWEWSKAAPAYRYLRALFLTNAYRFFAPNPGSAFLVWFRVQYKDGTVRWVELPDSDEFVLRMPYQRRLAIALQFGQSASAVDPRDNQRMILTPYGQAYVSSFVRHVARICSKEENGGPKIEYVQVYKVDRHILWPHQVRMGWHHDDLRNHSYTYVGYFDTEGRRVETVVLRDSLERQEPIEFAAQVLVTDVYRTLEWNGDLEAVALPPPIRKLLQDFPELRDPEIRRQLVVPALENPKPKKAWEDLVPNIAGQIDAIRGSREILDGIKQTPAVKYHELLRKYDALTNLTRSMLAIKIVEIIDRHDDRSQLRPQLRPPIGPPQGGEKPAPLPLPKPPPKGG